MKTSLFPIACLGLAGSLFACGSTSSRSDDTVASVSPTAHGAAHSDDGDDADEAEDDEAEGEDEEWSVTLDQVPANVLEAARLAVPGVVLDSCEVEREHGVIVYCLHGTVDGDEVEIEVTTDGKVGEIERG